MKTQLSKMSNIGKVLAKNLIEVGIDTPEKLKSIGSENAFIRLKTIDSSACLSKLCALEGAIQNIRWHRLDEVRKTELKTFFNYISTL